MLQHRNAERALDAVVHLLGNLGAGRRDEAQVMLAPGIRPQLRLLDDSEMERRAGRIPRRPQAAEPLGKVHIQRVRRKRHAAAGEQRRQHRRGQRVGVVDRRHVEASVLRREPEPGPHSLGGSQHVAVAEGNQVRLDGRARGVENECWRVRIGLVQRTRRADARRGQLEAERAVLRRARVDNGNAVLLSHAPSRGGDAAERDHGARAQDEQAPLDLGDGQLGIERHRSRRAGYRDDGPSGVRAAGDADGDPGIAIEAGLAQAGASFVDLPLQFPI